MVELHWTAFQVSANNFSPWMKWQMHIQISSKQKVHYVPQKHKREQERDLGRLLRWVKFAWMPVKTITNFQSHEESSQRPAASSRPGPRVAVGCYKHSGNLHWVCNTVIFSSRCYLLALWQPAMHSQISCGLVLEKVSALKAAGRRTGFQPTANKLDFFFLTT